MGKWKTTSSYDIYMVNTPHGSGGSGDNGEGGGSDVDDNGNNDDDANNNFLDLGSSLGPKNNDILNESLDNPNYDNLREEIGESSESQPRANAPTSKWTTTSTYDIYMVDTPRGNGGSSDNGEGGGGDVSDNENNDDNAKNNSGDIGSSLGPKNNDILNESLDNPNYDALRVRMVRTTSKITNEKRSI
ncbi:hypothetical protein D1007_06097 [Hordeum vulgare]|nr:hypothetical protein D1007_06097 [Hordeum vulgare]